MSTMTRTANYRMQPGREWLDAMDGEMHVFAVYALSRDPDLVDEHELYLLTRSLWDAVTYFDRLERRGEMPTLQWDYRFCGRQVA